MVLVLLATSCGSSRQAAVVTTAATAPTSAAPTTKAVPMFGDAPWPCGPAAAGVTNTATEQGVTADSITIGTGDDAGYAGAPGLSHELTDATKAFVAKCNELGGIAGRKVLVDYHDAKLFEVKTAITDACKKDFFLVGEGWVFDSQQEETRVACKLPAAPGYAVSGSFAMSDNVVIGMPNPLDEASTVYLKQIAALFPDRIGAVAIMAGNIDATLLAAHRLEATGKRFGFSFTKTLLYSPTGEADWTPFVKQIKDSGAKAVYFTGTCTPHYLKFRQTAKANGLDATNTLWFVEANFYSDVCAKANVDGAMDGTYVRIAFYPLEDAGTNKATQDYIDLLKANNGDVSQLGEQAASSFLLWAQAASECGADLTRACTLANMRKVTKWTGHGLHSEANPGGDRSPICGMLVVFKGTSYQRVTPTNAGALECDPILGVTPTPNLPELAPLRLDANRYSHQYDK
jgi:hypothetical protein